MTVALGTLLRFAEKSLDSQSYLRDRDRPVRERALSVLYLEDSCDPIAALLPHYILKDSSASHKELYDPKSLEMFSVQVLNL